MATALGTNPTSLPTSTKNHPDMRTQSDKDGQFRRKDAQFRNFISREPDSEFPPEKERYVLYVNFGCPWAQRTNIVRLLKGLDTIIDLVITGFKLGAEGWEYDGLHGSHPEDPLYGFTKFGQLYELADPDYKGRYTVPVLWDKQKKTIVNNESSEIIRMLYSEFDDLLPEEKREVNKPNGGLLPEMHRKEIEEMNEWVYNTINNGVYKTGFASTQEAYEEHLFPLFASLDRLEEHLAQPGHSPYLFGDEITEADIRLYPTIVRFDTAYHTTFKCNLKMIRYDYPRLDKWLRTLYWDTSERTNGGAFKKTTHFDCFKHGYAVTRGMPVVPKGPLPDILPP